MINFLRDSPHKFNKEVCDNFLKTHGLYIEFTDIVSTYMAGCAEQLDMSDLSSFTSESHLPDYSNKSGLKSIPSQRQLHINRVHNFGSILTQELAQTQHVGGKKEASFPPIQLRNRKTSWPIARKYKPEVYNKQNYYDRFHSAPVTNLGSKKKSILCPNAIRKDQKTSATQKSNADSRSINLYSLLFINELTQSALQRPIQVSFHPPPVQPISQVPTSSIYFR